MLKPLLLAIYQRVILSYKSTLIGMLLAIGAEVAGFLQALPHNWAHIIAAILFFFLSMWKDKMAKEATAVAPVDPPAPPPAA